MRQYELKLAAGKRVVWQGRDVDSGHHPGAAVIAWRDYPRDEVFTEVDARQIVEPGQRAGRRGRR